MVDYQSARSARIRRQRKRGLGLPDVLRAYLRTGWLTCCLPREARPGVRCCAATKASCAPRFGG